MSEANKSDWDVPSNPVLPYADSYRQMARTGTTEIGVWSVITDLERNIAPLWAAQRLRADTAEADALSQYAKRVAAVEELAAAEQRIAELISMLRGALPAVKYESKRGDDAGQQYRLLVEKIDAALNQKSEGESQ